MSSRAAQLAVELTERGASDTAAGVDRVTDSAKRMGDTVETASKQCEDGAKRLDTTAEGADELASKGSQAAGAMAGLGDLIGGPFGAAMQSGGIALQAAADSGDLLNAALENSIVASARSKAATIGKTIADKASAAATRTVTVAQKALNLAQRASPIGLIITGMILLVGALVLAYRRSATFRAVVQASLNAVMVVVDKVVGSFKALGPAVKAVFSFIATVIRGYVTIYVKAFQAITDGASKAWGLLKSVGTDAFKALLAPIQKVIDLVQSLIDKISSIHIPHPDINPFNRAGAGSVSTTTVAPVSIQLTVNPAPGTTSVQAQQTAQAMMDAIDDRLRLLSRKTVFS